MSVSSEITRRAKSNLAFALSILPRERREDMVVFYAFCRTMDDIADDPAMEASARSAALRGWREGLEHGFPAPGEFEREVVDMRDRNHVPNDLLLAIIDGCEMDLKPQRFGTWEDLERYTWKVACAVGLVSVRLFGCQDPVSDRYAVALGHALQLTNILRDIGEDLSNGLRIYLPLADLSRFQYTERDLVGRVHDGRFLALMEYEAGRAEMYFKEAEECLPAMDRESLLPARIMAEIYHTLLVKMRADGFRVFAKRYAISKARKLTILSKHLIARKR
ncbi:squalene/phytoene synthase family protein [Luteolibacter sp. SL250]|uniref:phytoene/squalene synthase family protein n=1 Tax=Luteolibacter sp. SL250 TaxID=2995170 RepID=UPI0022709567|nr:squalene/phytoene synthase family protein [Luteolibacter sp. SL250]WAC20591.1 squalene/phytoene synthase family protein [Luteolibacter sp. SL250]